MQLKLVPCESTDIYSSSKQKRRGFNSALLLTSIQVLMLLELMCHYFDDFKLLIPISFVALIVFEWVYFLIHGFKGNINIEILGFFLTTLGFAVAASATPDGMLKQDVTAIAGILCFIVLQFLYKNMEFVIKLRYVAGVVAVLLLGYNLIFGVSLNGAKNWIMIGNYSFQPSEIVKFLFIFTTAATLQKLLSKRNLILFFAFSCDLWYNLHWYGEAFRRVRRLK